MLHFLERMYSSRSYLSAHSQGFWRKPQLGPPLQRSGRKEAPVSKLLQSKLRSNLVRAKQKKSDDKGFLKANLPEKGISETREEAQPCSLPGTVPTPLKALPFFRHSDPSVFEGAHKPLGLVVTSALVLATSLQVSGLAPSSTWFPITAGSALGLIYVVLNRAGIRYAWKSPDKPLNVVVTGGTKGIGKALAREFLLAGDKVVIAGRLQKDADKTADTLAMEAGVPRGMVLGVACDVSKPDSIATLTDKAIDHLGSVDVWLNNAGYSGSFKPFLEHEGKAIERVVQTNLLGSLLCTHAAMRVMKEQETGGHVFNVEGAGSDGLPTVNYAVYGATKAGIAQLCRTLQREARLCSKPRIGVHNISPGMVLTDLLLEGATNENKKAFNILCEQPETVAAFLVPRIRTTVALGKQQQYIRYLTPTRAVMRLITAPLRTNRFFDQEGNPRYPEEKERLTVYAKHTRRLASHAARRSMGLGFSYAASLAVAYLIIAVDQVAKAHGN